MGPTAPLIEGCMDETACNYNDTATTDDESCLYLDDCGECGGDNTSCQCNELMGMWEMTSSDYCGNGSVPADEGEFWQFNDNILIQYSYDGDESGPYTCSGNTITFNNSETFTYTISENNLSVYVSDFYGCDIFLYFSCSGACGDDI